MSQVYRIDTENILHEAIEGEVVIVNLDKGTYYSLDSVGAVVWEMLTRGADLDRLVQGVTSRFEVDPDAAGQGITSFLTQLEGEALLRVSNDGQNLAHDPELSSDKRLPYSPPVLNIYTDMEQLLLVDPIHEVQDSGWPNVK